MTIYVDCTPYVPGAATGRFSPLVPAPKRTFATPALVGPTAHLGNVGVASGRWFAYGASNISNTGQDGADISPSHRLTVSARTASRRARSAILARTCARCDAAID